MVTTLDAAKTRTLIEQLVALPLTEDGRYAGAIARWLRAEVAGGDQAGGDDRAGGARGDVGTAVRRRPDRPRITWEGQRYRLDLGAAERQRLQLVREKQEGAPLDAALDWPPPRARSRPTRSRSPTSRRLSTKLTAAANDLPRRDRRQRRDRAARRVAAARTRARRCAKVIDELARDVRNKDVKRAGRVGQTLAELSDTVLADVLLSIAYAADVGDPDGTVLLAEDVSRRHDFGLSARDTEMRLRARVGRAARGSERPACHGTSAARCSASTSGSRRSPCAGSTSSACSKRRV